MAIPDWLPGVERVNGTDAGPMLPGTKWSLLLHTTEGPTLQGAVSALRSKSAWSHFIFDPASGQLVQAVSMNRAAKALRSGGNLGRTNAARVIQVEIVGYAAANQTEQWDEAVGQMIRRIAAVVPFDVSMPLPFYGQDAGFVVASKTARQRLSWPAWYRFAAICGHQHAPSNDHWDPGAIHTTAILAAARGPVAGPVFDPPAYPGHYLQAGVKDVKGVTNLKLLLHMAGYSGFALKGDKIGRFNLGTKLAVARFQRNHHLHDDGIVGPITWAELRRVVTAKHNARLKG